MTDHTEDRPGAQLGLLEEIPERALLDRLLEASRLYKKSGDYKELLDFVVKLRNFAPFNAMLLQVQKPGLSYAASARDWKERFGRHPKEGARPLLILWPFSPVALVYDVDDTVGKALPEDVTAFFARGDIDETRLQSFRPLLEKRNIEWYPVDEGDKRAGSIRALVRAAPGIEATRYRMCVNLNHPAPIQFVTLAHELGHLFLGHLGADKKLKVPERPALDRSMQELEAESVAYIVSERNGVHSKSHTYLSGVISAGTTIDDIDVYQVMRSAGQVETLLGLAAQTRLD